MLKESSRLYRGVMRKDEEPHTDYEVVYKIVIFDNIFDKVDFIC